MSALSLSTQIRVQRAREAKGLPKASSEWGAGLGVEARPPDPGFLIRSAHRLVPFRSQAEQLGKGPLVANRSQFSQHSILRKNCHINYLREKAETV